MTGAHTSAALAEPLISRDAFAVLDDLLGPAPTVEQRMMFGHRCFAVAGKVFACEYTGAIALKLPQSTIDQLQDPAIGPFLPGGRAMSGWIEIRRDDPAGYELDAELIDHALHVMSRIVAGAPNEPS